MARKLQAHLEVAETNVLLATQAEALVQFPLIL